MSHSCETDQCSTCLWKQYHSCLTNKTQTECEQSPGHLWCGSNQTNGNMRVATQKKKSSRSSHGSSRRRNATDSACGTCNGCLWKSVGPAQGCYPWPKATCDIQGSDYEWCGGNTPVNPTVNCCDNSTGSCTTVAGSTCITGTPIDSCDNCTGSSKCTNPYYTGGTPSGGLSTILPNNSTGLARWLSIFPALDPTSQQYAAENCGSTGVGRPAWGAGCLMYGQGGLNGLSAFLQVASQFKGFADGPDPRKNIIELASFFGNVTQETGDPPNGGLVYSAELGSCQSSMYGKGPIQLTAAINYQMATLGLNKPSDYNNNVTKQWTLSGNCATAALYPPADNCWAQCAAATPAAPPQGAGYNYCAKPWLASGLNDIGTPKLDPAPAWASALWYWMNVPINTSVAKTFYNIPGDVSCATAHNLIQDPQYNCGDWCPVAAIAQVGCPSCCIGPLTTLDAMTINRIGNFVKIASVLGLPEAQGNAADTLFCTLLNSCSAGARDKNGSTCPAQISYQCYLDGTCTGGGGSKPPICGNVKHDAPAPPCVVVPGNSAWATQSDCNKCPGGIQYWPCNIPGACQWASK